MYITILLVVIFAALAAVPMQAEETGPVARAKDKAREEFDVGLEVLRGIYRQRIADLISGATRVEVLLLDFSLGEEKRTQPIYGSFDVEPYSKTTPILASHKCTEEELKVLLPVLSKAISGQPHVGGYGCHFPVHGIRVYIGSELAFETSICWACGNFLMRYNGRGGWENHTDGFQALKPVLMKLMPIPDDEIARFKKGHDAGPDGK